MDKSKIIPYASEEELISNAENVAKAFDRLKEDLSLKEHGQTLESIEKSVLKNLKFPI